MQLSGPIQTVAFNTQTDGQELIAGQSGKKVRICGMVVHTLSAVTFGLTHGAGPTFLLGPWTNASSIPAVLPVTEHGWVDFPEGEGVDLDLNSTTPARGTISYAYI